ncbi:MAG: GNAT family N-acetyltransferase [Phycisphaerales bacterium]|jgi:RimJ/RimL family protein N-acetyltransferase|nr:GNAT family N-acetyltransferase [Phycisphaerales bacterium]
MAQHPSFPETLTSRLRLAPYTPDDAKHMFTLWNDDGVRRFIPGHRPASPESFAEKYANRERQCRELDAPHVMVMVFEREGGAFVGRVALVPVAWEGPEVEIAYAILPAFWGKGYTVEASEPLLDFGFAPRATGRGLELDRIIALANPENSASIRVMEKLRFRDLGTTDRWYDEELAYREMRGIDWLARHDGPHGVTA